VNTAKKYVFDFKDYKDYLRWFSGGRQIRRGKKADLAKAAECQPTYISQVLHGKAHINQEQAMRLSHFLNHTPDETQYFLSLVNLARAGTEALKTFYREQLRLINERRLNLVNRLGASNTLCEEDKAVFYSSWQYLAVFMALSIPELNTREALSEHFQIALERVDLILNFLFRTGLIKNENNRYEVLTANIRLGKDSPHIFRHHSHWRQQAIESLEHEQISELHYSAVVTLSRDDTLVLKDMILNHIKEKLDVVHASKEEEVYVLNVDFFNLKKSAR
jgi:uncharacterized protein (TIGR02147 family)